MFDVTVCTFTFCDIPFRSIILHVCCLILIKYQ